LLARVACDGGLLLVLDDLHCAELASLLLLDHAVEELGDSPTLIVASYSDADVRSAPSLQRQLTALGRRARRITMSGLSAQETAELMSVMLGHPPTPEHADVVYGASDGNPLFVQEAAGLVADGSVIPEELAGLVRQRFARLPPSTRDMLSTAAVLGPDFDVAHLQRASGESEAVLLAMLSEA
jgi:predicted ATPase